MPRNGSGTYTLPSSNPVEPGTLIEASWANTTMSDIGNEITNSLSRTGEGGMLAPFRLADGLQATPGIAWLNEPSTGFYRAGSGEMWGVVSGTQVLQYTANGVLIPTGRTFTAQGHTALGSTLAVTGATTLTGALTANGGVATSTLTTSGAATLASASVTGNLSVGGTFTLTGGVTLNGNVTVGDSSSDTLTINSTVTSHLLFTDNTYDIGASGATRPRHLYLASNGVVGGTLSVAGTSTFTGALTANGGVVGNVTGNVTGDLSGNATTATTATNLSGGSVSATTGSFSGNLTLSGGTANGVAYLNGSKVVTTGSALTFDGSKLTVSSSGEQFKLLSSGDFSTTGLGYLRFYDSGGAKGYVGFAGVASTMTIASGMSGTDLQANTYVTFSTPTEQMRLTSTGLGIGTSSPGSKLDVGGGTGSPAIRINGASASNSGPYIRFDKATTQKNLIGPYSAIISGTSDDLTYWSTTGAGHQWIVNNNASSSMTLDSSGNLGIGTSSPGRKLEVASSTAALIRITSSAVSGTGYAATEFYNGGGYGYCGTESSTAGTLFIGSAAYATILGNTTAYPIQFATNNNVRATIDSSGNLGLGVTPSAWSVPAGKTIEVGTVGNSIWGVGASNMVVGSNVYYASSSYRYANTGSAASAYQQAGGVHYWYNAPSGTAGNAITFTQAMTLDSSGRLGIGTTNPSSATSASQAIVIQNSNTTAYSATSYNGSATLSMTIGNASGAYNSIRFTGTGSNEVSFGVVQESGGAGAFVFQGYNGSAYAERARIDSSGNLQILGGSTNTAYTSAGQLAIKRSNSSPYMSFHQDDGTRVGFLQMQAGGASALWLEANQNMRIATNNTIRAIITSDGYFKASNNGGFSASSAPIHSFDQSDTGYYGLYIYHNASATGNYGLAVSYSSRTPNDTGNNFFNCSDSTATRASFRSNGGLANYQANDANLSDRREKTNFAPAKDYLDVICAIPVQTFNYIDQNMEDDPGLTLGVVAQDVEAVAPEFVMESNWGTKDEPKMRLSIYQTDLQYALMKCIQELKAQNDALSARLAALEAK